MLKSSLYSAAKRLLLLLTLLQLNVEFIHGFIALERGRSLASRNHPSLWQPSLQAARRQPATANKKQSKKKKNQAKQEKGKKSSMTEKYQPATNKQKKVKSPPPWQTLNAKQAKQNVQKEIERRSSDTGYSPTTENTKTILSKNFLSDTEARLLQWKPFGLKSMGKVEFMAGCLSQLPEQLGVPEVAFLGRSNVGKSSLLNQLANSDVARVGKTPGATASVNLYRMEDTKQKTLLGLVDLPGFGYAKLSKELKEDIGQLAETYLSNRQELAVGILLVDIRRVPKDDDRAVLAALYDLNVPVIVVATKLDKVSENERDSQLRIIQDTLGLPEGQPLAVSSVTGDGCRVLWRIIMEACEDHVSLLNRKYVEETREDESAYVEVFDDHEDIAYEQGYDWIHGSALIEDSDDAMIEADEAASSLSSNVFEDEVIAPIDPNKMKLRDWHKKSMEMERDGLL